MRLLLLLLLLLLLAEIGLLPGGSGYFTCIQNMKLVTNKFKSGGLHEKHVVRTWNLGDNNTNKTTTTIHTANNNTHNVHGYNSNI